MWNYLLLTRPPYGDQRPEHGHHSLRQCCKTISHPQPSMTNGLYNLGILICVTWSWDWVTNIFRTRLRSVQCSCPKTCEECKSLLTQETQYYRVPLLTTLALNKMLQNKYKSVTIRQHVFMRTQQNRSWMFVPELVEMVDLFVTIFLDSCQIAPDTCHCTWDWGWHGSMTRWQPPSYWQSASSVHWVFLPPVFPPHCLHWWSCRMLDWQWVASG